MLSGYKDVIILAFHSTARCPAHSCT